MHEEGSVGIVETKQFTFGAPPNEMELDCGRKLGPITLAYETYGELNADRSNAILIVHALSGDAHAAGYHTGADLKPGWWDMMIGPGKGFDTRKYCVICSNVLGGCKGSTGPSSIDPQTGKPYGLRFPIITIGDMVRAQKQLIEHLGIEQLLCVAGGSMGGMQTLEWMTRYPDMVRAAIVIASTPVLSPQALAFDAVGRHAIQADAAFENGDYYDKASPDTGLAIARMLGHITYLSDQSMRIKFGRTLRGQDTYSYDFKSEFSVETYLDYQGEQFVNRFDANSYLYITKAINYFDIAAPYGSLDEAMARVKAKTMVLSYSSDWLYPPYQSQLIVDALLRQKKDVTYNNIQSDYGHDAFLLEKKIMTKLLSGFIDHAYDEQRVYRTDPIDTNSDTDIGPPASSNDSIYEGHRIDYDLIVDLVPEGSRTLDIGCGDGELLHKLIARKRVNGMGIELSQGNAISCVRRGISVVQADVDKGLSAIPDKSYDYVILSMTLQVIEKPGFVLAEMLRAGKKCIISFPNFGYWKVRAKTMLLGKAPVTRSLPFAWHTSPNRHVLSIKDFRDYCASHDIAIELELALAGRGPVRACPNLLADEALFVIRSGRA
ncbi:MAG TPA: homoserine O-acetyltransferase [Candidatus Hydrogenedentes bacterium]|nr:homoserine O-acetyltransferase [Candidatus Hydrogenedentota bacterium]HOS02965.1 homoserine O-acetyltransferase [Candidatus Hydrogenedentota bacterium]